MCLSAVGLHLVQKLLAVRLRQLIQRDMPETGNSEQMNFYSGTTPMNDKVTGDGFPKLQPGVNTISWVGTVTSLVVQPRWVTL